MLDQAEGDGSSDTTGHYGVEAAYFPILKSFPRQHKKRTRPHINSKLNDNEYKPN